MAAYYIETQHENVAENKRINEKNKIKFILKYANSLRVQMRFHNESMVTFQSPDFLVQVEELRKEANRIISCWCTKRRGNTVHIRNLINRIQYENNI